MKKFVVLMLMLFLTTGAFAVTQDDMVLFRTNAWFYSESQPAPAYLDDPDGAGFNVPATVTSSAAFGLAGDAPLVGDVDGDGMDDILVTRGAATYSWFASHTTDGGGYGQLNTAVGSQLGVFGSVAGNAGNFLADINGDGADDAITINAGYNWYCQESGVGTGLGGGALQGAVSYGLAADQPIVGDFNGDGNDDIGVYRTADGSGWIFPNFTSASGVMGAGGAGPMGQIGGGANAIAGNDSLLIGDLNGDGFDDAVMVRQDGAGLIDWYGLINDGTGYLDFSNPGTTIVSWGTDGAHTPMLADFNGDGMDDICVIDQAGGFWYTQFTTAGGALGTTLGDSANFGLAGDVYMVGQFSIPEPATVALLGLGAILLKRKK